MSEKKLGRQTPTTSFVLPYKTTKGAEAIELYNKTRRTAQPWQELLIYDILAYNDEDLWVHTKYGYAVPRRNGKNEIVAIRELYGLVGLGEKIIHTAHRTTTSHSAWERLCELLAETGLTEGEDYKTLKQMGLEEIRMSPDLGGGRINFRTRSSKGGLGEGFDLMIIDEAQEYTDDQAGALKYVISSSMNPQTIYCGTPPTTNSSGTVFLKLRRQTLSGNSENTGWSEWSVDHQSDVHDRELWYETNPSLGFIISERSVLDEIDGDEIDFNIQRLGLWLQYNQKSAISKVEWQACEVRRLPAFDGDLYAGIKLGIDGLNACLSVAVKTKDERRFVECIDCQPIKNGFNWLIDYVAAMKPAVVIIDGQNGKQTLIDAFKTAGIKKSEIKSLTTQEYINANAKFEESIFDQTLCHNGQPSLENVVSNCEHRKIQSNGGFGYVSLRDGLEIGLLDSCVLALYGCDNFSKKATQRIMY